MDDFEKEYPDFDWKNTPAYKHPGGKIVHVQNMNIFENKLNLQNRLMMQDLMLLV